MAAPRLRNTWDGLPIADDPPRGATVVVRRADGTCLLLHRASAADEGDWAWTAPAGARQPGEPIYVGALRELAEESGIVDVAPFPVDLRGEWALFAVDVPDSVEVRLDHEHDRYQWLPVEEAAARCRPDRVAEALRRAVAAPRKRIEFRPLTRDDLPDLVAWRQAPHAAEWFSEPMDLAGATARYGPRIDGEHYVRMHVLLLDGQAVGYLQHYRVGDAPDYAAATGLPDAVGVDYLIGAAEIGLGLGPRVLWQYLTDVVLPAHPTAEQIVASPAPGNERSIRALEKVGFRRVAEIPTPEPELLCVLDVLRVFGQHGAFPTARIRPAVRIVCVDASGRVLLLRWRDPHDGSYLWEPPGGGIEPGESPLTTARRELAEETGLDPAAVAERYLPVWRDVTWNGRHYVGNEQVFLARFDVDEPAIGGAGLLPDEVENLDRHAWVHAADLASLPDHLEPPGLPGILTTLLSESGP